MLCKPFICLADQGLVKSPLRYARFIARNQQDRFSLRIEGVGHTPYPVVRIEAQFLHVAKAEPVSVSDAGRFMTGPTTFIFSATAEISSCTVSGSCRNAIP